MNIWRNNRYNIQAQVNKIITTTPLPLSIKFSDLLCADFPNFGSTSSPSSPISELNFRDDTIVSNRNDATHKVEKGDINLTMQEWYRISKFLESTNKLESEWTNIFNAKISKEYQFVY